ncbi:MAG: SNF2-related protein, partial [Nannocystaceae bacterium]
MLTISDLAEFHARVGGTADADALLDTLLRSGEWFRDGDDWQELVPASEYLYGDLWPRYDRCVARSPDAQADVQAARLIEAIDPWRFDDIEDVSPAQAWVPLEVVGSWLATINDTHGAPQLVRRDGILTGKGRDQSFSKEVRWFVGWANHYRSLFKPDPIEDWTPFTGLERPEAIEERLDKARAEEKDEELDVRRILYELKWQRDFRAWVASQPEARKRVEEVYNRSFRGFVVRPPDPAPLRLERWTDDPSYAPKPHQIAAARQRSETRGGILGMDVGVGKTITSLLVVADGRQNGWIRRPVVVVPSGLVWQWYDEISKVLPDYAVVVIGKKRRTITKGENAGKNTSTNDSAEERARKWTDFQAGLYDLALVSGSMLPRTKIDEDDVARYASERSGIMRSVRLRQDQVRKKQRNKKKLSPRQQALLDNGALAWVREVLKQDEGDFDKGIVWGDIGIDFLVIDEAGYYRNTFSPTEREFGVPKYMGSSGEGSQRAWQADFRASIVRNRTGGNGVLVLTGTLGENSPLEVYNIFHLINPAIFENVGIPDPEQWIDRYLDIRAQSIASIHGPREPSLVVAGFKNLRELRGILFRWGTFLSAREAGLKIPQAEECLATVQLDPPQRERYDVYRVAARKALKSRQIGVAFAAINRMRLITIHPELEEGYTWSTARGGL